MEVVRFQGFEAGLATPIENYTKCQLSTATPPPGRDGNTPDCWDV